MRTKKIKRKFGKGARQCQNCGNFHGVIRRYNLYYCRRCMRELGKKLGFKKFN
ncbi:MAG: 30S ribosomal protein S14 [Candidatus Aenigmatarchaeota archaeon]|nr:30S ribosomal protein S14 [Candidatus Aenigmarchaeota archaeon]RLJ04822.1 MAG: 30S ribosomal protein S14 [Candidatus Aenigmarchaeota archaeon]